MTVIELDGITGFRDVGGIPAAGGVIRTGKLFRSGHLAGLGEEAADAVRARIRRIIDLRADDEVAEDVTALEGIAITREPTLVHCTAGKDRTGVTIALALAAAGADREAIVSDYALTAQLIPDEHRRATSERLAAKYPQSRHAWMLATESPAEVMRATLVSVDAEWGSAADYLLAHGFSIEELAALRAALVAQAPAAPSEGDPS
ncbi:MAG: tyrosine-protein phosphatase [Microbacterium sp.]|uniref:tyrosine-protein phosphatase n=1 Tax=Microbacterium sp. TaxID=51671 RepID=UPI001E01382C|nr:tyrosine-protein phosphatase [Microbacterium sp.]MBW8764492.1 tyrosine-protein phosphatase [Microbacterium sp.]